MGGDFQRRSAALCILSCPPVHVPGGSDLLGLLPVMGADFEKFVSARLLGLLPVCRVQTLSSLVPMSAPVAALVSAKFLGVVLGGLCLGSAPGVIAAAMLLQWPPWCLSVVDCSHSMMPGW